VTHNRMPQSDYRLAEKLRKEYRSRGEDLRGIGAASTEELMDRAKRGRDPRENVSEAAFSERLQNRNYTYSTGNTSRTSSQYTRPAGSFRGGSAAPQYTDGRRGYTAQRVSRKNGNTARQKKHSTRKQKENREEGTEIRLRSQRLSVGFVAMLCIVTVMVMSIVFSIAQIYQTTNSIGKLENQLEDLREEAEELELALEKKNDIRVIEKIATDQLHAQLLPQAFWNNSSFHHIVSQASFRMTHPSCIQSTDRANGDAAIATKAAFITSNTAWFVNIDICYHEDDHDTGTVFRRNQQGMLSGYPKTGSNCSLFGRIRNIRFCKAAAGKKLFLQRLCRVKSSV